MEEGLGLEVFLRGQVREAREAAQMPPLVLAFIGDGVFEIFARTYFLKEPAKPQALHKKTASLVKAPSQAELAEDLLPYMTKEEAGVYRRGRNAQSKTVAKNASVGDYRKATGLEALFGYLYISGQEARLDFYFDKIERIVEGEG